VKAITVRDPAAGAAGLTLSEIPHPHAAENDVIVRVHAAGFTCGRALKPVIGAVRPLAEVPSAFAPGRHGPGKTIIRVTEGG
jgi:D-arabinose 1-dehydrogenase-like Zn-dependent alcohol dehydrogenase